ncbi:hypothetical protein M9Y10_002262 [Tritrichomonas musculus]|uniref:Uncharacterized protein n=1 Tax=Tritrichomonas musculus TaxID=1915356 RepID=A0ABR2L9A4_9EUKA
MQYSDVEKLRSKNARFKSIIWEHYRMFKQDLLQLQTDNENIRNQIFEEKQRHTEIVEQYSKKISLLEAELRNIRNYTPKTFQRRKINIHDPKWKLDELEEEGKYLIQEAESIFERAQNPKELLKKAQEKIISSQKKKPVRLDTDDSSSSCSNLFEKYDTLIMSSEEAGRDGEENSNLSNIQQKTNQNENSSKKTDLSQLKKIKKNENQKFVPYNEEKFVSQESNSSNNTSDSYSFRFNFENNANEQKTELDKKKSLQNSENSINKDNEKNRKDEKEEANSNMTKQNEPLYNGNELSEDENEEIFQFSQSDTINKNLNNSSSFSYSPQINKDYDKEDEVSSNQSKENMISKKEESKNEFSQEDKSFEFIKTNSESLSSDKLNKNSKIQTETKSDNNAQTQSEYDYEVSSKEMTNYFKLTNTDEIEPNNNTQKSENENSNEQPNGKDAEEEIENGEKSLEQNKPDNNDDIPQRKIVQKSEKENLDYSYNSSDAEKEDFVVSDIHINSNHLISKNDKNDIIFSNDDINHTSSKIKQNSSVTIDSQTNIKNDSLYSKADISPLHINDSSANDELIFESPNENEVKPNLKINLSPTANSLGGDSLSIGEESSDDGFFGRFNDSDIVGSNYS